MRKNCELLLIRKKWPYSQNEQSSEKSNRFKYKVCASEELRENLSTSVTGNPSWENCSLRAKCYLILLWITFCGLLFVDCIQKRDKSPEVSMKILNGRSCNEP